MTAARLLLLAVLCVAMPVAAAPVSEASVAALLQRLGIERFGEEIARDIVQAVPPFVEMEASERDCAQGPMRTLVIGHMRQIFTEALGEQGAEHLATWNAFIDTPAGAVAADMVLANMRTGRMQPPPDTLSPEQLAQIEAFTQGQAFWALVSGFDQVHSFAPKRVKAASDEMARTCGIQVPVEALS